jgi:Tfp pilus assembly protein PilV
MKHVKILGLAAVAAMALMAFAATSASATTLISGTTTITSIEATLTETAKLTETNGTVLDTCSQSTVSGKTTEDSAPELKGSGTVTWGGCTVTTDTIKNGEVGITWISGTENGTVKSYGAEVTTAILGLSCVYGTPAGGLELGTLKGSETESATIEINKPVEFKSGSIACPQSTVWKAKYKVTNPSPLKVVN